MSTSHKSKHFRVLEFPGATAPPNPGSKSGRKQAVSRYARLIGISQAEAIDESLKDFLCYVADVNLHTLVEKGRIPASELEKFREEADIYSY